MSITIRINAEVKPGTSLYELRRRITDVMNTLANQDREDEGMTRILSVQIGSPVDLPSSVENFS